MRISIKLNNNADMGLNSSFASKRAFSNSALWDLIKEDDLDGRLEVTYAPGYKNEFDFVNAEHLRKLVDVATEKGLVDEFVGKV